MMTLTENMKTEILTTTCICPNCHRVNNFATAEVGRINGGDSSKIRWVECHACHDTFDVVERQFVPGLAS